MGIYHLAPPKAILERDPTVQSALQFLEANYVAFPELWTIIDVSLGSRVEEDFSNIPGFSAPYSLGCISTEHAPSFQAFSIPNLKLGRFQMPIRFVNGIIERIRASLGKHHRINRAVLPLRLRRASLYRRNTLDAWQSLVPDVNENLNCVLAEVQDNLDFASGPFLRSYLAVAASVHKERRISLENDDAGALVRLMSTRPSNSQKMQVLISIPDERNEAISRSILCRQLPSV